MNIDTSSMTDTELQLWIEHSKKSGWLAALLNLIIPGAGYMYCGRWVLGLIAFAFVALLDAVALVLSLLGASSWLLVSINLMLFADGFLAARRYNRRLVEDALASRRRAPDPRPQNGAPGERPPEQGFWSPRVDHQAEAAERRANLLWTGVVGLLVGGLFVYGFSRFHLMDHLTRATASAFATQPVSPGLKAGWTQSRLSSFVSGCVNGLVDPARRGYDTEAAKHGESGADFPEREVRASVSSLCSCVSRKIAARWNYSDFMLDAETHTKSILQDAMTNGHCPVKGVLARALGTPAQTRSVSADDLQIVKGTCTDGSHIAEGAITEDLSKRRSRFFCDAAVIKFFSDNPNHVMVQFAESKSQYSQPLGFAGLMEEGGQILDVSKVYLHPGEASPVVSGACKFFFNGKHMQSIVCGSRVEADNRAIAPVVVFTAASGQ